MRIKSVRALVVFKGTGLPHPFYAKGFSKGLMVNIKPQGQFTYRVGTIDDVVKLQVPAKELMRHPYPFEIVCSPQRPKVIGIFQEGFLASPFDDAQYKEEIGWKVRAGERFTEFLEGKTDQVPRELIHIAYDPDLLTEEELKMRVTDTFSRLGYSPVRRLPNFAKKDVDLRAFIESQEDLMRLIIGQEDDLKAPRVRDNLRRFKDALSTKTRELRPYGLTLIEYCFYVNTGDHTTRILKGIDKARGL